MNFFTEEYVELHNEYDQLERQVGISKWKVINKDKNKKSGTVIFKPDENNEEEEIVEKYKTSLSECSCEDYQERQLPCIHMYRIANEFKLFSAPRVPRTINFIGDFTKGYAAGWRFIVRSCNYSALDIKRTPMVINKKEIVTYTQGKCYEFVSGSIFYDDIAAYTEKWGEAVKKIKRSIQIIETTPTDIDYKVVYRDGKLKRTTEIDYGKVKFVLYESGNKIIDEYECRQDEFVRLLKSGKFKNMEGQEINVYEESDRMKKIFNVENGHGSSYVVTFEDEGETIRASCTCQAGEHCTLCRHVIQCMEEDAEIKEAMADYGLLGIYEEYLEKNEEADRLKEEAKKIKKKFARLLLGSYRDKKKAT